MDAKSRIRAIQSILEMVKILKSLGISDEGIKTLEEMKNRVIDEVEISQKQALWSPGQVSVTLLILTC